MKILKDERGVAAVEMALVSPFLILGLLLMLDVGIAVKERMNLDHNTRTGAQAVMTNLNDTQMVKDLIVASSGGATDISVTVEKICTCDGSGVSCTTWCSPTAPPSVFLQISAARPHNGFLLPDFTVESQTHVQIR